MTLFWITLAALFLQQEHHDAAEPPPVPPATTPQACPAKYPATCPTTTLQAKPPATNQPHWLAILPGGIMVVQDRQAAEQMLDQSGTTYTLVRCAEFDLQGNQGSDKTPWTLTCRHVTVIFDNTHDDAEPFAAEAPTLLYNSQDRRLRITGDAEHPVRVVSSNAGGISMEIEATRIELQLHAVAAAKPQPAQSPGVAIVPPVVRPDPKVPQYQPPAPATPATQCPHCEVLYFNADWCGPCRKQAPTVARLKADTPLRVINIDREPEAARRLQVTSIPQFVAVRDGAVVDRLVGVQSETKLREFVSESVRKCCPCCEGSTRPCCAEAQDVADDILGPDICPAADTSAAPATSYRPLFLELFDGALKYEAPPLPAKSFMGITR